MKSLKEALKTLKLLALPYSGGPLTEDTDAYNTEGGCVLLRKQPGGTMKLIGYWFH